MPGQTIDLNSQQPDAIIRANNRVDNINSVYLADVCSSDLTDILIKKSRFDSRIGLYFSALDVVFGSPNLKLGADVSLSDGQADATVTAGVNFSVVATGDVNGDGVPDILIGAPGATSNENGRFEYLSCAYVILGSTEIKSGAQINTAQ